MSVLKKKLYIVYGFIGITVIFFIESQSVEIACIVGLGTIAIWGLTWFPIAIYGALENYYQGKNYCKNELISDIVLLFLIIILVVLFIPIKERKLIFIIDVFAIILMFCVFRLPQILRRGYIFLYKKFKPKLTENPTKKARKSPKKKKKRKKQRRRRK